MSTPNSSIYLKAFQCQDGRQIHFAVARLQREPKSSSASILDMDNNTLDSKIGHCFIFFYPMGPNRRLLEAVISHYAPKFECDKDILFLCVNRPGKGTSSSLSAPSHYDTSAPDERQHVLTSMNDIVTIMDHYDIGRASLLYMCAGSTFAYSFATKFPERTTGYIIGIASWVLRSDPSSSSSSFSQCNNVENGDSQHNDDDDTKTPQMHSLTHRMAMHGFFGPKWMVSHLAGGIVGSMSTILGSIPPSWVGGQLKKDLSDDEIRKFDERYPDGEKFVEVMKWIHNDGCDEEVSVFVNNDGDGKAGSEAAIGNRKEGDARDCAVCLSTQQDLGLIYKTTTLPQKQVLLWHGEADKMISISGAEYLEAMIPNATLTRIPGGTHQGVMFFFPDEVMEALNRISRDVSIL